MGGRWSQCSGMTHEFLRLALFVVVSRGELFRRELSTLGGLNLPETNLSTYRSSCDALFGRGIRAGEGAPDAVQNRHGIRLVG